MNAQLTTRQDVPFFRGNTPTGSFFTEDTGISAKPEQTTAPAGDWAVPETGATLILQAKKSSIGQCALIYTFPSDPAEKRTFEFHEGEDKLLGEFNEFVISNTIQGMLAAIKRFQIFMKRKEEENTGENYKDLV